MPQCTPSIIIIIKEITDTKRTGGIAQVVECLPSNNEVLSSNPTNVKNGWFKLPLKLN
jgi:hypothetical protein